MSSNRDVRPLLEKRRPKNFDAEETLSENSFDFDDKDEQQR